MKQGFIKICGMTDAEAVEAALSAGADAVGFVFAKSPRQVTPSQAAQLAAPARGRALCVAVTLHPDAASLQQIFEQFRPDVWQSDLDDMREASIPAGMQVLPVLRAMPGRLTASLQRPEQALLFEGPRSGTGQTADWSTARMLAAVHRVILAGGLSSANVAEAIQNVRPHGVDVSSGVETAPGRKSPALIESFVTTARAAFARAA